MTEMLWYKRFHGTAYDPKFTAAASEAESTHCNALGVWDALLETTSENEEDRGSLANVDLRVVAAGLHLALDEVQRVWNAFVSLGMIAGKRVAKWAKRQGARVAAAAEAVSAAALRTRRWRQRKNRDPRQQEMFFVVPGGAAKADATPGATCPGASPRRASPASHPGARPATAPSPDAGDGEDRLRDSPPEAPPVGEPATAYSISDGGVEVLPPEGKGRHVGPNGERRRRRGRPSFEEIRDAGRRASLARWLERARMAGGVGPQRPAGAAAGVG